MKHQATKITIERAGMGTITFAPMHFLLVGFSEDGSSMTFVQSPVDATVGEELVSAARDNVVCNRNE